MRVVAQPELVKFYERLKAADPSTVPARDPAWDAAKEEFRDKHVPRRSAYAAHEAVWGKQRPGPRGKNSAK
jgi:hypothetical protein